MQYRSTPVTFGLTRRVFRRTPRTEIACRRLWTSAFAGVLTSPFNSIEPREPAIRPTRPWLIPLLAFAVIASGLLSLAMGSSGLPLPRVIAALAGSGDAVEHAIVVQLRLPRALLALFVGGTLGITGAALQGYLRNPLAEPSVLGTSNAAALGAVIALYFGLADALPLALPALAIFGALLALAALFVLAGLAESSLTLILAGIAVSTLAGAGISLALNLAPNPFAAIEIMTWLLGSLADRSFAHLLLALPCVVVGIALVAWNARALDALTLGEDAARALGADLDRMRLRLLVGVAIAVGGTVAVAGAIGFIGLIVPHIVRPFTDRAPSSTLWPSALAGAVLLTLADVTVRVVPTNSELRLGVVTAFLGVPVFLGYLLRERRLW